jgi:hypothetical protein
MLQLLKNFRYTLVLLSASLSHFGKLRDQYDSEAVEADRRIFYI